MKKTTTTITAKRIAIAVAAVCASLSMPASANENKAMLDLMLKKGVITQKDYDEFMEANKDADENKAFKDSRIDKDVSKSITFIQKRANDGAVKPSGFGYVSGDGKSEINLTGRLHMDARIFDSPFSEAAPGDSDLRNSTRQLDMRRARIGINGKFLNDFNYEMVWNAAASDGSNVDTAWINYSAKREAQVRVGRFKQPFNLEDYGTSSNNIDFIERSYVNQLNPGKKPGFMLHGIPYDGTVYALSVFQENNSQTSSNGSLQVAGRLATDIAKTAKWDGTVLHLGVAGTTGTYDGGSWSEYSASRGNPVTISGSDIFSFRSEHRGVNAYNARVGIPGTARSTLPKVDRTTGGVEFAYLTGPFKFQAEYAETKLAAYDFISARNEVEGRVKAHYLAVVYNLTGEQWTDSYKDGAFSSIKIKSNFDPSGSGMGAWQVGLRFSSYDASGLTAVSDANGGLIGGSNKGNTMTLGLNWFINPNSRIMLNHSVTRFDQPLTAAFLGAGSGTPTDTALGSRESVTTVRVQYNF